MRAGSLAIVLGLLAGCASAEVEVPCGISIRADPAEIRVNQTSSILGAIRNCGEAPLTWSHGGCGEGPFLGNGLSLQGSAGPQICVWMIMERSLPPGDTFHAVGRWNGTFLKMEQEERGEDGTTIVRVGPFYEDASRGEHVAYVQAGAMYAETRIRIIA